MRVTRYVKKLRGALEVTHSTRLEEPSLHLDPHCDGLERVPADARATRSFPDVRALALEDGTRLCRMCTLEAVLRSTLRADHLTERRIYVTCSAEPWDNGPFPGHGPATPSGERRLARVAKLTGFQTERTPNGVIVHGWTDSHGAQILERNLRTLRIQSPGTREQLELLWALVRDDHGAPAPKRVKELWHAAKLLT